MREARLLLAAALCSAIGAGCSDECPASCEMESAQGCDDPNFADLDVARAGYRARCDAGAIWVFEAECENGTIVLRSGTGYTSEGRFYDPKSGEFLGLTTTTDVVSPPCDGKGYWPDRVACRKPVVTRVLCGSAFAEGDAAGRGVTQ
jgi:hypothetical protein